MDQTLPVDVRDCASDAHRKGEKPPQRNRAAGEDAVERLATEVLDDERRHALVRLEGEWPRDGRQVQRPPELVLAPLALESLRAAPPRIEHLEDHRRVIGAPDRTVQSRTVAFVQGPRNRVRESHSRKPIKRRSGMVPLSSLAIGAALATRMDKDSP